MTQSFATQDPSKRSEADNTYAAGMATYFTSSLGSVNDRLRNFTKYVSRQELAVFVAKQRLFEMVLGVHGNILEGGVFLGGGLMTWAQLSAIHEPYNHTRRIVGFDTFAGFPQMSEQDEIAENMPYAVAGGLNASGADEDLRQAITLYDINRPLGHIERVELHKGDATETIPAYVEANPQLVVALLYLDFDIYEPTLVALEHLLPRMPKGAVLAFDELNYKAWPGETMAVVNSIGLRSLQLRRFEFVPQLSYAILE